MTTNDQTKFQNDNIAITLRREPGCRVHLDVIVNAKAVQASQHQAVKSINKEVSIPGFRKGKAPQAMLSQNFAQHIEKEWKDIVLNTTLDEAFRLTKVYPFNKNSVKSASIKSISLKDGATLSFEYEEAPQIPTIAPEELAIAHVERPVVKDEDIVDALEDLRLQKAEWVDVTDRPVQAGDFVDIDVDIISEPARNVCTSTRFVIAPGKMDEWMRRLLIGMTPGQVIEGMSEKEDKHGKDKHDDCHECGHESHHHHHHKHEHAEAEFTPVQCRIMLHAIKKANTSPLDDEFAKSYGATSLEDLKEKVTINLNKRADEHQINNRRALMEQLILSRFQFDIPYSFVQMQLKDQRKAIIDSLRAEGTDEALIGEEAKKIELEIAHKIDHDMRLYFLTQRIARDHHIDVSEDEVMMEWMRQMWLQKMGQNTINLDKDPKEAQAQLHLQMLIIKTLDYLIDKAQQK